jgi:hypothetical protein
MISMQMADENIVDPAELDTALSELHLGALAAVYQKQTLMCIEHMSGWIPLRCGQCRTATKYSDFHLQSALLSS